MHYWLLLAGAIVLEVAGTMSMKLSQGLTLLTPSVLIFVFYAGSFVLLSYALTAIDVGVAYAVWSGIGTALVATLGVLFFGEPMTALKLISIVFIIVGVGGLNVGVRMGPASA